MDDCRPRPVAVGDRLLEQPGRGADGTGVRRVVQERGRRRRRRVELGAPPRGRVERQQADVGARQRGARGIVGVVRVGQEDRVTSSGERGRELDDRRLRSRHDRDLAVRVDGRAVDGAVAFGDRLAQARKAPDRGVAVDIRAGGRRPEGLDHVRRRPDLGIAAPEVDDGPAAVGAPPRPPCRAAWRSTAPAGARADSDVVARSRSYAGRRAGEAAKSCRERRVRPCRTRKSAVQAEPKTSTSPRRTCVNVPSQR